MVIETVPPLASKRSAFTLVEVLLTTVLLLLLLGAVVFSFSTLQRNAALDEGATQFEALFRFARAQAASSGRQVRIAFEEDAGDGLVVPLGNLRVEWEPDPLNAPGIFSELFEAAVLVRSITDLVRVEFVTPWEPDVEVLPAIASSGDSVSSGGTNEAESVWITFPPVTFFPDGSSDSSEITLASRDEDGDGRRLILKLRGLTGAVRRTLRAAEIPGVELAEPTEPGRNETRPAKETLAEGLK
jgi:type II secretory pathway pseudopilin PulG